MAKLYKEEELKEMLEKLQKSGCPYICCTCGRAWNETGRIGRRTCPTLSCN